MTMKMDEDMQECIRDCLECHAVCLQMLMNHCLETGDEHLEPTHVRLMRDCSEICKSAAGFMLSGSQFHTRVCSVCAEICTACAESCDGLEGMEQCAEICRSCAASCQKMAAVS